MSLDPKRLQRELEAAQRQVALLRSQLERINNINWTPRSNRLVRELIQTVGQLELEADPTQPIKWDDSPSSTTKFDSPMPGESTAKARRTLESFQRRIERAIRDQHARWDSEVTE